MASAAAALVVHDLKNELGALEATLERLAATPDLQSAHRQCRALRQRFVSYLTLYGADSELRAVCEDDAPQAMLQLVARRAAGSAVDVVAVDTVDAPPFWHFDRRLVGMALDAALHNALRFARRRIELRAREDEGHLVFSIDDDGPGVDPCATGTETDTGLGTALCRAVAQAHGTRRADGGVRLFNRPVPGGTGGARFELWLAT